MILVAYRHGLRASEVCDLQRQQIDLSEGRLHVHRVKNGIPSVHPIRGDEMRALRKLRRDYPREAYVHKNARLTPRGRERIVLQVESGQTPEAVAQAVGVCPRTVRKWVDFPLTRINQQFGIFVSATLFAAGLLGMILASGGLLATAPRLRALHRAEDIGSALKRGANVCHRQLVNEVLGPLVTEFVRNFGRENATPSQRDSNVSLLGRV